MKRYAFRLEAVLKVRKLKEESCRTELGQLLVELNHIEDQITHDREEIGKYYELQEGSLSGGMKASQLQAFPMLVAAKEKNIQLLTRQKNNHERYIEEKKEELAILRGELKVIENLKEKDYTEYRKAMNKEIDQKVEEQTQNWMNHNKKKA
jgi:flagellar export protein FliJ